MSGKPEALTATDGRWEAAADWLQRLDHPDLSEEELQAWLKWHDESEQNRRAFEDMQGMYRKLGSLSAEQKREMWRRVAPAFSCLVLFHAGPGRIRTQRELARTGKHVQAPFGAPDGARAVEAGREP